jgi:hypothetical protein
MVDYGDYMFMECPSRFNRGDLERIARKYFSHRHKEKANGSIMVRRATTPRAHDTRGIARGAVTRTEEA